MTDFSNLFIPNTNMTVDDIKTGTKVDITQYNVSKYFNTMYVLVKKNNTPISIDFYNSMVTKEAFERESKNFMLYKVPIKCLKNKKHFDNCIILSPENLEQYNIFNYTLDKQNIILPILNIEYNNIIKYFEQYETTNTLQNIYKIKVVNNYFSMTQSSGYISMMIANMEEAQWWTHFYNCMFNASKKFKQRKFSTQYNYLTNKILAKVIKTYVIKDKTKEVVNKKEDNYIEELSHVKKIESMGFDINKYITTSEFTKDDTYQLFLTLNDKERFMLYSYMMISPKYCHLVVCNSNVMKMMSDTENKFPHMFRYIKSYAFIELYKKECIRSSTSSSHNVLNHTDECVFSIAEAHELKPYPFNHMKPKMNPYMPILVSDSLLKPAENFIGIPDYNHTEFSSSGICNLANFKTKMNIFTTSNPNNDLFANINFKKLECCITGGIMSACVQEKHPLLSRFVSSNMTELYSNFFNEYYVNSDIDVMFKAKDNFTFIDNVTEFYNMIVLNICTFNPSNVDPSYIKLVLNKLAYIFVSEKFIETMNRGENSVEYIKENINEDNIKELFKPYFDVLVKEYIENLDGNLKKKYPDIFKSDVDFKVYIKKDNTDNLDINMAMTYKYKITSPYLNHTLELFPIKQDDFMNVVSSFHLPCVRAYYDGTDVYMTTSCVIAHMTYMNIDYKYFTGTKDSFDIILKYMMRGGWGLWMNTTEKEMMTEYCKNVPFHSNLFSIFPDTPKDIAMKAICSPKSLNHKLFRPRFYNMDDYTSCSYVELANRYINTVLPEVDNDMIQGMITNKFKNSIIPDINYDKFISINSDGYIVPVKKYIIEMTWEMYNKSLLKQFNKKSDKKNYIKP